MRGWGQQKRGFFSRNWLAFMNTALANNATEKLVI